MYSLRLSLYRFDASTLAGDDVLGSFSRLLLPCQQPPRSNDRVPMHAPLDASQDGRHVISRAPPILENVQTELAGAVDVGVEHLADELDARGLVRVCLLEVHHQPEGSIFEGCVCRADDDCVPVTV